MSHLEDLRALTYAAADTIQANLNTVVKAKDDLTSINHELYAAIGGSGVREECAITNIRLATESLQNGAQHLDVAVKHARATANTL